MSGVENKTVLIKRLHSELVKVDETTQALSSQINYEECMKTLSINGKIKLNVVLAHSLMSLLQTRKQLVENPTIDDETVEEDMQRVKKYMKWVKPELIDKNKLKIDKRAATRMIQHELTKNN